MVAAAPTWADEAILEVLAAQLGLLALAGWLGWRQLREQVRPFVVVDLDERYPPLLQLRITNVGAKRRDPRSSREALAASSAEAED
jgi:hypothetical protein